LRSPLQGRGLQVDVYSIVGGVPTLANGSFTLLFPIFVSPTNP
jgi:hypothetical protein